MIKVEKIDVWGFEHAIRGMRNPMNSWLKSDSSFVDVFDNYNDVSSCYLKSADIGKNDLDLMRRLYKAGTEHRKYARQIFVSMDITSNHFWWAEFDTYKIGVTRNSCSKMHRIHIKEFVESDFSHEGIDEVGGIAAVQFRDTIDTLEWLRNEFNESHDKKYWRAILKLLPMGYNIKATVTMTYENVFNIIHQRGNHKVFEWIEFTDILKSLPYVKEITEE